MGTESRRPAEEITTNLLSPVSASSLPRAHDGLQQNGVLPSSNPLGTRPLEVNTVTPGLLPPSLLPVTQPQSNLTDQHLPPLPQKLRNKILKREYVDFTDLLSSNMYPVHTSSSADNFTLAINPDDTSTLSFVPSQQKKRHHWSFFMARGLEPVLSYPPLRLPSSSPRSFSLSGSDLQV